eukprot:6492772-Amphidinium_carterae.3
MRLLHQQTFKLCQDRHHYNTRGNWLTRCMCGGTALLLLAHGCTSATRRLEQGVQVITNSRKETCHVQECELAAAWAAPGACTYERHHCQEFKKCMSSHHWMTCHDQGWTGTSMDSDYTQTDTGWVLAKDGKPVEVANISWTQATPPAIGGPARSRVQGRSTKTCEH